MIDFFVSSSPLSREKNLNIIDNDIPRTFPHLGFFKPGGNHSLEAE